MGILSHKNNFCYWQFFLCLIFQNRVWCFLVRVGYRFQLGYIFYESNVVLYCYIHSKKYIGNSGEESQIYTAELVVKDNNGQEIRIKVYGEGGC